MAEERIKTALEIALEKSKNINISDKELKEGQLTEEGKKLAGQFLNSNKFNLQDALKAYSQKDLEYIRQGMDFILFANISFPKNENDLKYVRKVMEGIVFLKKNKQQSSQLCGTIEQHLDYYLKQKKQVYDQMKKNFLAQMSQAQEEMEKKIGTKVKIDVENMPEFRKEWNEVISQIEQDFGGVVEDLKNQLKAVP